MHGRYWWGRAQGTIRTVRERVACSARKGAAGVECSVGNCSVGNGHYPKLTYVPCDRHYIICSVGHGPCESEVPRYPLRRSSARVL